ncbi:helix-turn-helix domain-containing protein [Streptomyces sp. SAJ15]|uniref:nSTAND1 domain-containing NTPase n=1 Tax=Streptomyces sp. SAJ15 TaxID=2011095 RepID=UPI001186D4CC|nr:helix-turn-helix domain-containing protein [Streptomyces sp. SAJ15]TVL88631.1 DNA-binding protein [Streptomyces sp. SAJ15]
MGRRERPVDPSAGPVQRFAYELRKLREEAGGLTYRAMAQRARYSVTALSQAAAGEQLPSLPVALAYVEVCGGDRAEWEARWREAAAEAAEAAVVERAEDDAAAEPPYRGLARFEPGDHERFFGRDGLVADVVELARSNRFTAVFGPSGSGKSSLLRAGLIPVLRDPALRDPGNGGGAPSAAPAPAVIRVLTPGEHPARTHRAALTPKAGDGDTWLIVDQFEEVFTLCQGPAERREFIDALLAARQPESRLRVVVAVRADFFGRCAGHRGLTAALRGATLLVGPMGPAELREAIVKPAAAAGLIVERSLTARIVAEVADEPGGLPLMSHALLETWRRRRGRTLTEEAYESVGGVHGAIAATAERVHGELSAHQAELARRILLRLITPGEGAQDTRRPADRAELETGSADATGGTPSDTPGDAPGDSPVVTSDDTSLVLERLVRARLVTVDDGVVDLAHEALITAWPRLRGWIEEDRGRLRVHRKLTEAARSWQELHRDPGALYRGARLAEAEEAFGSDRERAALTPLERAFLTASSGGRRRSRRRVRAVAGTLSLLLVLAVLAGTVAWQQNRESDQRRAEATSRRVASIAETMRYADPVTALRLSAAAWRISHTDEARAALLGAVTQQEQDSFTVPGTGADGIAGGGAYFSADGRTMVRVTAGRVQRWDVAGHRRTGALRLADEERVVDLSRDGRRLLVAAGGRLTSRDLDTGKPVGPRLAPDPGDTLDTLSAEYAPSGRMVLLADDRSVRLWDVRRGRLVFQREGEDIYQPVVSPDDRLVTLCAGTSLELWDIAARRRVRPPRAAALSRAACSAAPTPDGGRAWEFDPRGRGLAVGRKELAVWDLGSGKTVPVPYDADTLDDVRFSRDGRFVSTVGDRKVTLWRISADSADSADSAEAVYSHELASEFAVGHWLDLDRGVIRYQEGIGDGTGAVRTLFVGGATASPRRREPTQKAAFSPDGRLVVTARLHGDQMWFEALPTDGGRATPLPPVDCGTADRPLRKSEQCWAHLAFSGDGRTLAYGVGATKVHDDPEVQHREGAGARPERIAVWDLRENRKRAELVLATGVDDAESADAIALSPDGSSLFALRQRPGAALERWDARRRTEAPRHTEQATGRTGTWSVPPAGAMAVRPDGQRLATTHGIGFTLPSGRQSSDATGQLNAQALAYSPDGERLALGSHSGRVTVYDGDGRRPLGLLSGTESSHVRKGESVAALAYAHDGATLAVAGTKGTVRLWDAASGRPLGTTLSTAADPVLAIAFSPDDRTLLVAGARTPLRAYPVDPARATAAVCERAGGGLSRADWSTYIPEVPYRDIC